MMSDESEIAKLSHQVLLMSQQINGMSQQLTTALVQVGETRAEVSAVRRDIDRIQGEYKDKTSGSMTINGWTTIFMLITTALAVAAIVSAIYFGGNNAGF